MKNILLAICLLASFVISAQRAVDSLWAIWNDNAKIDTIRMSALHVISRDYYAYTKPDSALLLSGRLYDMAVQRHMQLFTAKVLNTQVIAFVSKGDFARALARGRQALTILRNIKHYKGVSAVAENIGTIYMKQGEYHRALGLFFKGLELRRHIGDSSGIPGPMINIASVYLNLGKTDSALRYHERALAIAERHAAKFAIFTLVSNLGNIYQRMHRMEKAFLYNERARQMGEEFGSDLRLASVYNNLLCYYRETKDFEKALEYQRKSMAINERAQSRVGIAESMHLLSTVYYEMGKLEKARRIGETAIKLLGRDSDPALRRDIYSNLSNIYSNQKNYKKALRLVLRVIALKDSIRNDSLTNTALMEQSRIAAEKKELLLKTEADKRFMAAQVEGERRDQKKNIWIILAISLLLILVLSGVFSYRHWRQKNIITAQKNKLLAEKLLLSQMNPHFIFNSLNAIQNFIFKQDNYLAGIYLKQFSELMRMILEFSRRDYISLEEEYTFLMSYLDLQKLRLGSRLNYCIEIDERLDRESVLIPPMLGQPFVENAIEHGIFYLEGQGVLIIKIRSEGDMLVYEVEDNGVGLAAAQSLKRTQHKSLASDIIRERLIALHQENSEKRNLQIIDKNNLPNAGSGVIVRFIIP